MTDEIFPPSAKFAPQIKSLSSLNSPLSFLHITFSINSHLHRYRDGITAIATSSENPDMILTASRDKTIIMWTLTRDDVSYTVPFPSYERRQT